MAKALPKIPLAVRATLLFVGVPVLSALLLGSSIRTQGYKTCKRVDIVLENQADNFFLDLAAVRQLIDPANKLVGSYQQDVYLSSIERRLHQTLYVRKTSAYFTTDGTLHVNIELRKPIARVLDKNGTTFFVDAEGYKIPQAPQYSARTVLVRGSFTEHKSRKEMVTDSLLVQAMPLLRQIHADAFFKAQVSEIVLNRDGEATLVPQVGNTMIVLGRLQNLEVKLPALLAFYRQVLNKTGWDYYRNISLKYDGQIVATKSIRESSPNR